MAFTVTPSSGGGPYTLSADITSKTGADGVHYALELRGTSQVGSCFLDVSLNANRPGVVQSLLNDGSAVITTPVAVGSCMAYSLIVRDLITNNVVSYENVYIDNV